MPGGVSPAGEFISAEELSQWLVLGKTRTWELLASGEIPSYKIGRLRRIKKADVERYLEARRYDPKGVTPSGLLDVEDHEHQRGSRS